MRLRSHVVVLAIALLTFAGAAQAQMVKCTSADGTVAFQSKPCASSPGDPRAMVATSIGHATTPVRTSSNGTPVASLSENEIQQRAVESRAETQRRDRCRTYRETAERYRGLLASDAKVDRKGANDEIVIQERRMRDDNCGV